MGRRALPKIDPTVDFSRHLGFVEELSQPFDPQSLFDQPRDLELEVGSGKGHFVLTHSEKHPERNFLGNEIARKYARFAAYRLAKQDRENARIISGDGLRLFREFLPSECAVGVHVYFPDPWWKERHRRRRVIQPGFVSDLQRVLKAGGIFHFWTDVEQYFEETCQVFEQEVGWSKPVLVSEPESLHDMDYRTHFERRMRKNGHDVFRAQFTRR
ncbi:MAG: tRNA (guanosine(46)-N7)-methyltransferase TrmB [Mariniblastus sp.]|nr:tRNA (guanosine(46)-N7)-methyltransferase TrmB [Mariniblastus sp.]